MKKATRYGLLFFIIYLRHFDRSGEIFIDDSYKSLFRKFGTALQTR
jgi:hypothetical protein